MEQPIPPAASASAAEPPTDSGSWDLPANLQICAKCGALNPKTAIVCTECGYSPSSTMKYAFQLPEAKLKTRVRYHWGLQLNLQVCPQCKTLNAKKALFCIQCGNPFSAAKTRIGGDDMQEMPEIVPTPQMIGATPAATPPETAPAPVPDAPMALAATTADGPRKQHWLRRSWLAILALAISGAALLLVPSSFQLRPATFIAKQQSGQNAAHKTMPPLVKPESVPTQQKVQTALPDRGTAATVQRAEPPPLVPPSDASASVADQPTQPAAAAHTPCTQAAQALALCN